MARKANPVWHTDEVKSAYFAALLNAASDIAASRRTVVSSGIGFKYSRSSGYGRRRVPCLKFFVRRKRKRPSACEAIPEHVTVIVRGRKRRVATDIVDIRRGIAHSNASCRLATPGAAAGQWTLGSRIGSCGFFVRSQSEPIRYWLATAGHVFLRTGANFASCDDRVVIDGEQNGPVACDLSYFQNPDGELYDLGVARVRDDLSQMHSDPQSRLTGSMSVARLLEAMNNHEALHLRVHSALRNYLVAFDAVVPQAMEVTMKGGQKRTYGATLVLMRTLDASMPFCPGDSGATITSEDGTQLVGIHFLGLGDAVGGADCRMLGMGLYAGSVKRLLETGLGPLELVTGP